MLNIISKITFTDNEDCALSATIMDDSDGIRVEINSEGEFSFETFEEVDEFADAIKRMLA